MSSPTPQNSQDSSDPGSSEQLFELVQYELEKSVLGGERRYTLGGLAEEGGVSVERARRFWIALGFAVDEDPEAVAFTDGDAATLRSFVGLVDGGAIDPAIGVSAARALGQSMSRLAEWQIALMTAHVLRQVMGTRTDLGRTDEDAIREQVDSAAQRLVPKIELLQSYVWRRHLVASAGRSLASRGEERESRTLVVGFADMVGYTSLTRRIDIAELTGLLERFESAATSLITQRGGWIIKNVGDEVMFGVEDPCSAAHIAVELHERVLIDGDDPELRVGLARGPVLVRFGDAFGSVVNIAARLTSTARPGTVLIDQELAAVLADDEEFSIRSLHALKVRGFRKLKPFLLRRAQ